MTYGCSNERFFAVKFDLTLAIRRLYDREIYHTIDGIWGELIWNRGPLQSEEPILKPQRSVIEGMPSPKY